MPNLKAPVLLFIVTEKQVGGDFRGPSSARVNTRINGGLSYLPIDWGPLRSRRPCQIKKNGAVLLHCSADTKPCTFPNDANNVCGSDGNTYLNIQELECLAMERRRIGLEEIFLEHEGPCEEEARIMKRNHYGRFSNFRRSGSSTPAAVLAVGFAAFMVHPVAG